jgi:hypothetical protein
MSSNISIFHQDNDFFSRLNDGYLDDRYDDEWEDENLQYDMTVYSHGYQAGFRATPVNPAIIIVVVAVILGIVFVGVAGRLEHAPSSAVPLVEQVSVETAVSPPVTQAKPADVAISTDALTFAAPYTNYAITQGVHGASYGHMAIDIAAGRGEPLLSPINGIVTQLYMDEYGNPTIVIENDVYQVMFLHGDYTVAIGDTLKVGQVFGAESNKGYTMDMAGNLCYNREWCGNHSHLNVFDKRIQANVNPLGLFGG